MRGRGGTPRVVFRLRVRLKLGGLVLEIGLRLGLGFALEVYVARLAR